MNPQQSATQTNPRFKVFAEKSAQVAGISSADSLYGIAVAQLEHGLREAIKTADAPLNRIEFKIGHYQLKSNDGKSKARSKTRTKKG